MTLPPRDHQIPLATAATLTRRYREQAGAAAARAGAFHADQVQALLAQKGCAALRIYYGTNEDGSDALILVGVDENDRDMTAGILDQFSFPCPPYCDDGSGLNS